MKALYFGTEHCPQCKVFKPRFEEECKKLNFDYEFIDAEKDEKSAVSYGVRSIPYIIVLNNEGDVISSGLAATQLTIMNTL